MTNTRKPVYYDDAENAVIVNGDTRDTLFLLTDAKLAVAYHVCGWCRAHDYEAAFLRHLADLAERARYTTHYERAMLLAEARQLEAKVHEFCSYLR